MAMLDNRAFLISHMRKSFITSDDTQMSEIIIDNENLTDIDWDPVHERWKGVCDDGYQIRDPDVALADSPDIQLGMDFSKQRRRSNTVKRLDQVKKEQRLQKNVKHVQWRVTDEITDDDRSDMFTKRLPRKHAENSYSSLSELLNKTVNLPDNPFKDYAMFDGSPYISFSYQHSIKTIDVFPIMQSYDDRCYPMKVIVLVTEKAKIADFIGLTCWQYINEGRKPALEGVVSSYSLYIAEDDGEPDFDFPPIDSNERLGKYDHSKLCLVKNDTPPKSKRNIFVNITLPQRGRSTIPVESTGVYMKDILAQVLKKRHHKQRKGFEYILEKEQEQGVAIDLEKTLGDMDTSDFYLIRFNSGRGEPPPEISTTDHSDMTIYSQQYKSYLVSMMRFLGGREVQLGISGEKIEIDPVKKNKLDTFHGLSYEFDCVLHCEITADKSTGKSKFRLYILSSKGEVNYDFEADTTISNEIVQKINKILEMRASPVRKYLEVKEKRNSTKFYVQ